ncbi:MAG: hypothetical protein IKK36_02910 [Bacteroidales bacterium]|jgi:hypothetical protein|nr:hypothetical protein [Bacteroidales bacterium]
MEKENQKLSFWRIVLIFTLVAWPLTFILKQSYNLLQSDGVYELTVNEWASNHIIGIIGSFIAGVIVYFFLKKRESNK